MPREGGLVAEWLQYLNSRSKGSCIFIITHLNCVPAQISHMPRLCPSPRVCYCRPSFCLNHMLAVCRQKLRYLFLLLIMRLFGKCLLGGDTLLVCSTCQCMALLDDRTHRNCWVMQRKHPFQNESSKAMLTYLWTGLQHRSVLVSRGQEEVI